MKRILLALAAFLAVLPGCLPLDSPLSDPMLSSADTDLCGVWQPEGATHEYVLIGVQKGEDGAPQGLMQFCDAGYSSDTKAVSAQTYEFFVTELKGVTYANILYGGQHLSKKTEFDAWNQEGARKVGFLKYQLKDGVLTVWTGDEKALNAIKQEKKLDSTAALIAYLKEQGDSAIFPDSSKHIYHKLP